jgi:acetyl/propionyl-CoA carboxylase alpha subunit
VYAEDPARKFLPAIGFLTKYKEPTPHEDIRIDTGVQEGSEISMYYDPMISKLIAWGKDRKTACDLLQKAMDEYVIRGVVSNLGFGQSILRNVDFYEGHYTTAFIPKWYPNGFKGDPITPEDIEHLALSSHFLHNHIKNFDVLVGQEAPKQDDVVYVVMKQGEDHKDYKIERTSCGKYEVTELAGGKKTVINAGNFDFEYGSLIRFD